MARAVPADRPEGHRPYVRSHHSRQLAVRQGRHGLPAQANHNLDLPKRLQIEFDKIVQNYADTTKKEVKDEDIWRLFKDEYLPVEQSGMTAAGVVVGDTHDASLVPWGRLKLLKVAVSSGEDGSDTVLKARLLDRGVNVGVDAPVEREVSGIGNGPIAAFLNAISNFGVDASIMDYAEHTMSVGTDAMAASYVECQVGEADDAQIVWASASIRRLPLAP